MNPSFKAAIREALDRPLIIADRFHYCRYIYWGMDKVRRRIQKEWHSYDRKKCKRMRHVFYKDSTKLTEKQEWHLKRYIGFSSELGRAYDLKESYCRWFKQAKENGPTSMNKTKESLHTFYEEVKKAKIPEFLSAIKTLKNWQSEILNSFATTTQMAFWKALITGQRYLNEMPTVSAALNDLEQKSYYQVNIKESGFTSVRVMEQNLYHPNI